MSIISGVASRKADTSMVRDPELSVDLDGSTTWDASATMRMHLNELYAIPHPGVIDVVAAAAHNSHHYPSPDAASLRSLLADRFGLAHDQVVTAAGSVMLIQQLFTIARPGEMVTTWPGFEALIPLAQARNLEPVLVPARPDGVPDLTALRRSITPRTSVIVVASPHSPTGGTFGHAELSEFLTGVPPTVLVLVDQAYVEFSRNADPVDPTRLIERHQQLLVTRTFSKAYGLAGLRVGYGLAHSRLASAVAGAGVPFAVTAAAEAAACYLLQNPSLVRDVVANVHQERDRLVSGLRSLGVQVSPGDGNFVWVPDSQCSTETANHLRSRGVHVKDLPEHGVRITVSVASHTDSVLAAWPVHTLCPGNAATRFQ